MEGIQNLDRRNVLGSFFGGVLGVLFFGLFHFALSHLIGCFIGVIAGFYHREIWEIIQSGLAQMMLPAAPKYQKYEKSLALRRRIIRRRKVFKFSTFAVSAVFAVVIVGGVTVLTAKLHQLLAGHLPKNTNEFALTSSIWFLLVFMLVMTPLRGMLAPRSRTFLTKFKGGKSFRSHSLPRLAFLTMKELLKTSGFGFLLLLTTLTYGLIVFVPFLLLGYVLLSFVIVILKGINKLVWQREHWLCLAVTFVVTTISTHIFKQEIVDRNVLWLVALGTGFVSTGTVFFIRRVLATEIPEFFNSGFFLWVSQPFYSGKHFEVSSALLGTACVPFRILGPRVFK